MKYILFVVFGVALMSSCTINRNVMFKTDQDFVFDTPDSLNEEYIISPNDILMIRVFSNNGALLINQTASDQSGNQRNLQNLAISYTVQPDGKIKLPEVGLVDIAGKTIIEAQEDLQIEYNRYHNDTYALVSVLNNRIIIFPGSGGDAMVITLENNNISVIEALALAGGITDRGDASKVKLIRRDGMDEKIFFMDMSTIEGIQYAQMTVQAYDIIYVEPVPEIASEVFEDVSPIVQIISGVALIYAVLTNAFAQ